MAIITSSTDKKYSFPTEFAATSLFWRQRPILPQGPRGSVSCLVEGGQGRIQNKGRNLEKIGAHAADLAELFFADVHVPVANLVSEEGGGFGMLMDRLVQSAARPGHSEHSGLRSCDRLDDKIYKRAQSLRPNDWRFFRITQFVLAQLHTETTAARIFTDWSIRRFMDGALSPVDAAKGQIVYINACRAKWWISCLQFFGGYGYMREFPIARAFVDSRLVRIGGGAVEVLKQIIGRDLFKAAK